MAIPSLFQSSVCLLSPKSCSKLPLCLQSLQSLHSHSFSYIPESLVKVVLLLSAFWGSGIPSLWRCQVFKDREDFQRIPLDVETLTPCFCHVMVSELWLWAIIPGSWSLLLCFVNWQTPVGRTMIAVYKSSWFSCYTRWHMPGHEQLESGHSATNRRSQKKKGKRRCEARKVIQYLMWHNFLQSEQLEGRTGTNALQGPCNNLIKLCFTAAHNS